MYLPDELARVNRYFRDVVGSIPFPETVSTSLDANKQKANDSYYTSDYVLLQYGGFLRALPMTLFQHTDMSIDETLERYVEQNLARISADGIPGSTYTRPVIVDCDGHATEHMIDRFCFGTTEALQHNDTDQEADSGQAATGKTNTPADWANDCPPSSHCFINFAIRPKSYYIADYQLLISCKYHGIHNGKTDADEKSPTDLEAEPSLYLQQTGAETNLVIGGKYRHSTVSIDLVLRPEEQKYYLKLTLCDIGILLNSSCAAYYT